VREKSIAVCCYNMFVCMNSFEMEKKLFFVFLSAKKGEIKINGERFIVGRASRGRDFYSFFGLIKKALKLMTIEENALTFNKSCTQ
jgi:hypothetical protein